VYEKPAPKASEDRSTGIAGAAVLSRSRRGEFKITEPIKLDDLRWLVDQCVDLPGDSSVTVKEHKAYDVREWDEASITVNGDLPVEKPLI
jgi:hypothetical protein